MLELIKWPIVEIQSGHLLQGDVKKTTVSVDHNDSPVVVIQEVWLQLLLHEQSSRLTVMMSGQMLDQIDQLRRGSPDQNIRSRQSKHTIKRIDHAQSNSLCTQSRWSIRYSIAMKLCIDLKIMTFDESHDSQQWCWGKLAKKYSQIYIILWHITIFKWMDNF